VSLILKRHMNKTINKVGFRSGLIAFASTAAYVIVQLLQVMGVLPYPLDEILIYGTSLCIVIPFVLEMLALHYATADTKSFGAMPPSSFLLFIPYSLHQIMLFNWQR
jgi:hypothetical protein